MRYTRREIVKWITLILGLVLFLVQLIRYSFNWLGDYNVEKWVAVVWLILIIAPFTVPSIINKFTNKK